MMITLRLIHFVLGVFWGGAAFVTASFLLPSAKAAGPGAGPMMRELIGVRRLPIVIMVAAILTVLSGLGMYWLDNSISNGAFAKSRQGMTLGIGAVIAIVALVIGMVFIAPSGNKLTQLTAAITAAGGPPSAEQAKQLAALQARMMLGSRVVAGMLAVTIITMAIARYV
jgi:hypothetical protein